MKDVKSTALSIEKNEAFNCKFSILRFIQLKVVSSCGNRIFNCTFVLLPRTQYGVHIGYFLLHTSECKPHTCILSCNATFSFLPAEYATYYT